MSSLTLKPVPFLLTLIQLKTDNELWTFCYQSALTLKNLMLT